MLGEELHLPALMLLTAIASFAAFLSQQPRAHLLFGLLQSH